MYTTSLRVTVSTKRPKTLVWGGRRKDADAMLKYAGMRSLYRLNVLCWKLKVDIPGAKPYYDRQAITVNGNLKSFNPKRDHERFAKYH